MSVTEALSDKKAMWPCKKKQWKGKNESKQPTITSAFTAYIAKANFVSLVCLLLSYFPFSLMCTLTPVFLEENKANAFC